MVRKKHRTSAELTDIQNNFHYDPISGSLFRKRTLKSGKITYKVIGHNHQDQPGDLEGHYRVVFRKVPYYVHHICWFLSYQAWPTSEIDHINRDKSDNCLSNLRLAGRSGNYWNRPPFKTNKATSKYKGVHFSECLQDYRAVIAYTDDKGKQHRIYLGRFHDEVDAALAYNEAALQYHGEFAYLNKIGEHHR